VTSSSSPTSYLDVPETRRVAIQRMADELRPGKRIVISTHVNADGDGCGSEVALVHLLTEMGVTARIVNPTPWPSTFAFLLNDRVVEQSVRGAPALTPLDALLVVDINDTRRLGVLGGPARDLAVPKLVIDHHVASQDPAGEVMYVDATACATGELVYDFARTLGLTISEPVATALYCAILTDTGGFRFSNTSPRCHAVAADLLAAGVDPETMYRRIYASVSPGKLYLLRDALDSLQIDEAHGISWISLPAGALERYGVESDELDGIVEHPRSVSGTRMALFFRDLGYGKVKVSFRSTGDVDANQFARQFGGGGHARASGALITGGLDDVRERVLTAARTFVNGDGAT
jgi:bifunctional oligoribonuclease and PAP phosphatase NrnA